jgi:predicted transcriptional regulator
MVDNNRLHRDTESPIGDVAYLARSPHRIPALVALTERPRSRSELCELTGVSSSTIRRTLDEFEDRVWVRKDGHQYAATRLGEVVASGTEDLLERVETERKLRDVWHCLPDEVSEFPVETWETMTVTVAEPDSPYRPVDRFESLLEETNELRLVRPEIALMEPCFDVLVRLIDEGVDVVLVARPESHTYFLSTYPERSSEMMRQDNFRVLEDDDLPPCGTGLLDERVAISCYERDSGTVHALVDTEVVAVREWAQSVCETYTSEAQPVEPR